MQRKRAFVVVCPEGENTKKEMIDEKIKMETKLQQCSSSSRTSPTMGTDLQHYWLRNAVQYLVITTAYVSLSQTVADLFTKAVQPQVVAFAVPKLGLTP